MIGRALVPFSFRPTRADPRGTCFRLRASISAEPSAALLRAASGSLVESAVSATKQVSWSASRACRKRVNLPVPDRSFTRRSLPATGAAVLGCLGGVGGAAYNQVMSLNVAEVEQALLALDQRDRAAVIHRGLRSLDAERAGADQAEVDAAWRTELRRRIDDVESGDVKLLDVDESHAQLRVQLAARRG